VDGVAIVRSERLIVYAFDVDHTLEISGGPVKLADLMALRVSGAVVGICGNWMAFVQRVSGWQHLVSFMNPGGQLKPEILTQIKTFIPADDYVMVGNVPGVSGASDDIGAAALAGWRFIKESDFAAGHR
jgi:hypothetical protein